MPRKLGVALLVLLAAVAARADVVIDWNKVALGAIRVDKTPPPRASRALACVHAAIFDAVNGAAGGGYTPYLVPPVQLISPISPEAAAVSAAYETLVDLFPAQKATFDAARAASLAAIPEDPAEKSGGIAWGQTVAEQILAARHDDGAEKTVDYEAPLGGNWWAATPPAFAGALLPNWPYVTPWAMTHAAQFRQGPPPSSASPEYLASFREVERLGRVDSAHRTAEQTQIALFWADGPGTATPPGHWHVIAQGLAQDGLNLIATARLFALLAITGADAAIVSWDHKYYYSNWRPVTGIQKADIDGNPDTTADPRWEPLIATPPFPAYTSGHSTFSGSSARLLGLLFGFDEIAFSTTSDGLPGVTRSFTSFSQAAAEAGQSRIYGGIHWQYDNQVGLTSGRALAEHVFFNFLTPIELPFTCAPGPTTLCLADGRFKVQADWKTATSSGAGNAESQGKDSGRFWFFNEDNTELTVKVLNACNGFDRFWVFASGLTNVEVLITVTDAQTGRTRQYFNPQGKAFAPVQDTKAFATCP